MSELSVKEAAVLLKVSETTLERWIRQGVIPTIKVREEYHFDQQVLVDWARAKHISGPTLPGASLLGEEKVNLTRAIGRGGVHHGVTGDTVESLFQNALLRLPLAEVSDAEITREAMISTLLEREKLVSTGIGQGIAIPHPRQPRDWGLEGPTVGVF
ncbi:MAG: helix-turn-helix domain-containing protein, partial [Deltaproteobacteria bacterium]|nr:helix-turn-helix domain-containing protein [Deltaproteobacteria bacterium]